MVLESAIGLIFVYLLFSLMCSALSEIIAWMLNLRARTLRSGIETLLHDASLTEMMKQNAKLKAAFDKAAARWERTEQSVATTLYAHPLIRGMTHDDKQPSYIPKHTFAAAFIDMLHTTAQAQPGAGDGLQKLRATIAKLPEQSEIRQQLEAVIDETVKDVRVAHERVEKWFDDSMERVSGWYKRRAHVIVLSLAVLIVGVANADSVMISQALAHDSVLRQGLVAAAEQTVRTGTVETRAEPDIVKAVAQLQQTQVELNALRIPVGWTFDSKATIGSMPDPRRPPQGWEWVSKLVGLLATVLAVSMGAPFWFDILNKVVNARLTGAQTPESTKRREKEEQDD